MLFDKSTIFPLVKLYFQANSDAGQGAGSSSDSEQTSDEQTNQGAPVSFASFDDWYKTLTPENQKLADPVKSHFERMQATVRSTREERDALRSQLKETASKLKDGSDEQKAMLELQDKFDEANRKADFYEQAPDHRCLNVKAAYALAKASDLFDKRGNVDWKSLEEQAPQLFSDKQTKQRSSVKVRSAGASTDEQVSAGASMNDWIRKSAGVN